MKQIGEVVGKIVGDTLNMVAKLLGGATDLATAGPFAQGLKAGFDSVKGSEAVTTIFQKLLDLFIKGIVEVFKAAPFQVSILAGLVLLGPAIAAALGTAIVGAIPRLLSGGSLLAAGGRGLAAGGAAAGGLAAGGAAAGGSSLTKLFGAPAATAAALGARQAVKDTALGLGKIAAAAAPPGIVTAIKGVTETTKGIARFLPGRVPLIGAGIDVAARMLQGQGAAKAAGGGAANLAGSVIGGTIGTFIAPGIGTAIGATAGSIIGSILYDNIVDASKTNYANSEKQRLAAATQAQAAEIQAQAAKLNRGGAQSLNTFGSAANFNARLGLVGATGAGADAASKAYLARNVAAEQADAFFKQMNAAQQRYLLAGYSPERVKQLTEPLADAYKKASDNLNRRNTELDRAIGALGPKVAVALADSLQRMPTSTIEAALAAKLSSLNFTFKPFEIAPGFNVNPNLNTPPGAKPNFSIKKPGGVIGNADYSTFAYGSANPRFASSLGGAIAFENAHKPSGSSLVIANSSETIIPAAAMGYFPSASLIGDRTSNRSQQTSVNAPITIYQQPGQSPKELAAMVAMEISNAVADVRNSSYYV
jgi:hypothetical protein